MSVSLIVAVTTPLVWAAMLLACVTVALPLFTLMATEAPVSIVVALIAVSISAAVPVSVVTPLALTFTVVLSSSELRSDADAVVSVTVRV